MWKMATRKVRILLPHKVADVRLHHENTGGSQTGNVSCTTRRRRCRRHRTVISACCNACYIRWVRNLTAITHPSTDIFRTLINVDIDERTEAILAEEWLLRSSNDCWYLLARFTWRKNYVMLVSFVFPLWFLLLGVHISCQLFLICKLASVRL